MKHLETLRRIAREQRTRAQKAELRAFEMDRGWTAASQTILKMEAERERLNNALTRIRTEDLSRFDCILIAAEAQGLIR